MDGSHNGTVDWTIGFQDGARFWMQNVFTPIVALIGIVGNAITIAVLTRKRMKSSTNTYLTALAVADLFFLMFNFLLSFWHHPALKHPKFLLLWQLWGTILWFTDATSGMSVWMTVSFTLERYIAVCYPLRGKVLCTESRARKVVLGVVLMSLLLTATTPFEWTSELAFIEDKNKTVARLTSTPLADNDLYVTVFHGLWSLVFMLIPFAILLVLNTLLILAVRKSQRHRIKLTEDCRGMTGSIRQSSRRSRKISNDEDGKGMSRKLNPGRRAYREKQENKITMALVSVVCLFLVCQSPTAIMLIIKVMYKPDHRSPGERVMRGLGNICNFLVLVNATLNFLLYCAMSDKYRHTLLLTFCRTSRVTRSSTFSSVASFKNSVHHHPQETSHDT